MSEDHQNHPGSPAGAARDTDSLEARFQAAGRAEGDSADEGRREALLFQKLFGGDEPLRIGRFRVDRRLGAGAMGTVYAAWDDRLGRLVAVKVLRSDRLDASARERLVREARGQAQVSHPNVVSVYEVGEHDGQPFIVMEYVAGERLDTWQSGRSWREVLEAYLMAARGLHAVHSCGLVHRDFKAANVLVTDDGQVKVADFGLVGVETEGLRSALSESQETTLRLTQTGALVGTPAYMAPEQLVGGQSSALADQFGFCVALWEALYGVRPFDGADLAGLLASIAEEPVRGRSPAPRRVRAVLLRGMSMRPENRWPSLAELVAALERLSRPQRRRWYALGVALLLGLLWAGWALRPTVGLTVELPEQSLDKSIDAVAEVAPERAAHLVAELVEDDPSMSGRAHRLARTARVEWSVPIEPSTDFLFPADDDSVWFRDAHAGWFRARDGRVALADAPVIRPSEAARATPLVYDPAFSGYTPDPRPTYRTLRDAGDLLGIVDGVAFTEAPGGSREYLTLVPELRWGHYWIGTDAGDGLYSFTRDGTVDYRRLDADGASWTVWGVRGAQSWFGTGVGALVGTAGGEVFELRAGQIGNRLPDLGAPVTHLAYNVRTRSVAALSGERLYLWSLDSPSEVKMLPRRYRRTPYPRLSFDGRFLMAVDIEGTCWLYQISDGRELQIPARETPSTIDWSVANGLFRAYPYGRIDRVSLRPTLGELVYTHPGNVWSPAMSPDRRWLALPGRDGTLHLVSTDGSAAPRVLQGATERLYRAVFSSDGSLVASGSADGSARVWDVASGRLLHIASGHIGWAYGLAFSDDGRWLATSAKNGVVRALSLADGSVKKLGVHGVEERDNRIHTLVFTPDGGTVVSAAKDGSVIGWPLDVGQPRHEFGQHLTSPDIVRLGDRVISRDPGSMARIWAADLTHAVRELRYDGNGTFASGRSADGRWFTVSGTDRRIALWDLESERPATYLNGLAEAAEFMEVSTSGTRIVAGEPTGALLFWDLEQGDTPVRVFGHASAVRFVGFDPEGNVLSVASDGDVRRWRWPTSAEGWQALLRSP